MEKLDRWFSTVDWELCFPNCLLQALSSSMSDHCPILMSTNVSFLRKSRFHFQSFWPSLAGYQEAVAAGWFAVEQHHDPFIDLQNRLRATARVLTRWSQRRVGNIKEQLLMANEVILQMDKAMEQRVLNDDERWLRGQLKKKVLGLASLERTIARQRSRLVWIQEGDANTAFFHLHANGRKRKNHIFKLKKDSETVTDPRDMEMMATNHFVDMLGQPVQRGHTLDLAALNLPAVDLEELELPFSEEEIWAAIRSLPPDKAPGPDGFSARFFQSSWTLIKETVMRAICCFDTADGRGFSRLNEAYITLLPKKEGAVEVGDFRPISLLHSVAKIVSKAMALRLAAPLPFLVNSNQSAFVKGRSIQDNFFMVQHSIRSLHRRRVSAIMLKVDVAKAFDSVAWPFLLEVLRHRGFGPRWISRLVTLFSTANTRVLINGNPGEKFWHARGLRQGDPVSPTLFIMIIDVLNAAFQLAEECGLFESLERVGIRHRLSLFADDVVLLIKPIPEEAEAALQLLRVFGEASGLRCNLAKSSASPIRCEGLDLRQVTTILSCPIKPFPIQYLGLPLSLVRLSKTDLQPLVDKIAGHVPTWKASLLERSGRLVLLDSTLTATPVYHMLSLDLPQWFFNSVNKILKGFFWSAATEARRGQCVVAWDMVCSPKELGGLGVKNLKLMNHALRMRWRWMQLVDRDKPWQGLDFTIPDEAEQVFLTATKCELGNGLSLNFWRDRWMEGQSMKQRAPNLWSTIRPAAKRASVAEALNNNAWIRAISGEISVPAIVEFMQVCDYLQTIALAPAEEDRVTWRLSPAGVYSAKTAYEAFFLGRTTVPCAKLLWSAKAPLKYKIHMWLLIKKRLWTADRLAKHRMEHPPHCMLCCQEQETMDHLTLQCSYVREVWFYILSQHGLQRFTPEDDEDISFWWPKVWRAVAAQNKREFNSLILLVARELWLQRNAHVFDRAVSRPMECVRRIIELFELWGIGRAHV